LLLTIPGIGELLGLTITAEIGEIARFASARKLIAHAGLTPAIKQSEQSAWTGRISKADLPRRGGRDRGNTARVAERPTRGTGLE
jgi:transposase